MSATPAPLASVVTGDRSPLTAVLMGGRSPLASVLTVDRHRWSAPAAASAVLRMPALATASGRLRHAEGTGEGLHTIDATLRRAEIDREMLCAGRLPRLNDLQRVLDARVERVHGPDLDPCP